MYVVLLLPGQVGGVAVAEVDEVVEVPMTVDVEVVRSGKVDGDDVLLSELDVKLAELVDVTEEDTLKLELVAEIEGTLPEVEVDTSSTSFAPQTPLFTAAPRVDLR